MSDPNDEHPAARLARSRPLWELLAPVRPHLVGCVLLSALAAAAGLLPYVAVAEVARGALAGDGRATVWPWVGVGAGGAAARLVLVFASSRLGHVADATVLHLIRVRLVRHLGVVPIGWFRDVGSGRLKKVMTSDLEEMHQLIAHALGEVAGALTVIVVGLAYLASVDVRMALVTAGVLGVVLVAYRVAMRSMSTHMARLIDAEGRIAAASVEYADGAAVVKAFGTGGRILARFGDAVADHGEALAAWARETRWSTAIARVAGSEVTTLGCVCAVGLPLVATGSMSATDLLPALVVGVGLPTSIVPVVHGAQGVRKGRVAAGNILDVLERPGLPVAPEPALPDGGAVELDAVSYSYDGTTPVLQDVSLTLAPGTVTAVVGPSGAGKTTLATLVPRFADVDAGAIRIGGADVRTIPDEVLLAATALVFQDVVLVEDTVRENIRLGRLDATDDEVEAAARAAHVHHVIGALPRGYDTVIGPGTGLSGGERQRVTIARAILSDAPIVVLDEATASLDPESESSVQAGLAALAAGRTVLVIAHRLASIAGADQIVVLDAGRIVERGTHEQLLAGAGLYSRMWRAQDAGARMGVAS